MKCPKFFFLMLFLLIIGCSSKLEIAGQEHALVFQKWQSLANYAGDTFADDPIYVVARLNVVKGLSGNEFILEDFQLTNQETSYQLNLRTPEFENKIICDGQCLFLTEYLASDESSATMLSRYYDKYEFELFKLYGDIFTLKKSISEIKSVTPQGYAQYLDWIQSTNTRFADIPALRQYLLKTFSVEGYTEFVQNPNLKLAHLLSRPENSFDDNEGPNFEFEEYESTIEASIFSADNEFTAQEAINWIVDEEMIILDNSENFSWFADTIQSINIVSASIGDVVCVLGSNEFGQVNEERGRVFTVNMLGTITIIQDGIETSLTSDTGFAVGSEKSYTPLEGVKTYLDNQVTQCDLR
ncbi:hypothetical protein [uncultured Paraglaciecola sp.]|uniref:hypothetical protein n=1 Tax=uncultured Paraglaciecola sp. TaxID=1765024 RepID=UPI0025FBDA64|nr:hypothetical protein [uncultured Paraglaciecola sp.]